MVHSIRSSVVYRHMTCPPLSDYSGEPCNFKIAIPSRKPPTQLCTGTLAFLQSQAVDLSIVSIFVATSERAAYKKALAAHGVSGPSICTGAKGMVENMMEAYSHYPDHTHLITMIDTVSDILYKRGEDAPAVSMPQGMLVALATHA